MAIAGIPIVLVINYLGGWLFAALIGLTVIVAQLEMVRLLRAREARPALVLCLPASLVFALLPAFIAGDPAHAWVILTVALTATGAAYYLRPATYSLGPGGWMATIASSLYIGLFLGHIEALRHFERGAWWVFLVLIMTWAYDSGAYFAGSRWGSRPFMQHISSKKTWEGVIGGVVLAALAGLVGVAAVQLAPWQGLALGAATGIVAQTGDLVVSMIKRQAGVKDSGRIIPGHGGLLDRIDSLLFTGVLGYYAATLLGHAA